MTTRASAITSGQSLHSAAT